MKGARGITQTRRRLLDLRPSPGLSSGSFLKLPPLSADAFPPPSRVRGPSLALSCCPVSVRASEGASLAVWPSRFNCTLAIEVSLWAVLSPRNGLQLLSRSDCCREFRVHVFTSWKVPLGCPNGDRKSVV